MAMVLAVLEQRGRMQLGKRDIFSATVGGVKLTEPAADLARGARAGQRGRRHARCRRPGGDRRGRAGRRGPPGHRSAAPAVGGGPARLHRTPWCRPTRAGCRAGMRVLEVADIGDALRVLPRRRGAGATSRRPGAGRGRAAGRAARDAGGRGARLAAGPGARHGGPRRRLVSVPEAACPTTPPHITGCAPGRRTPRRSVPTGTGTCAGRRSPGTLPVSPSPTYAALGRHRLRRAPTPHCPCRPTPGTAASPHPLRTGGVAVAAIRPGAHHLGRGRPSPAGHGRTVAS